MTVNELDSVYEYLISLENWKERCDEANAHVLATLKRVKADAVAQNEQQSAKTIWCLEQILEIQNKYLIAFTQLKSEKYYDGWCTLERVEITLNSLEHHFEIDAKDIYKLRFIQKHGKQLQSLFPYKLFISPAYLYLEKKCSICGQLVLIRHPCGHIKGEIYNGEQCIHEITKFRVLEVSTVPNPVQKYSVLFLRNSDSDEKSDHYDYSALNYLMRGLREPFDAWDLSWTKKRHHHSLFSHIDKDDKCPCGSGKIYRKCCLRTSGVLRPHVQFTFHVPPPEDLPRISYPQIMARADMDDSSPA